MKTINLELSKRLAPYLENIDTEYLWHQKWNISTCTWYKERLVRKHTQEWRSFKTLTLEEVIEFLWQLPFSIKLVTLEWWYNLSCQKLPLMISDTNIMWVYEGMLEYLLDNDLLW